MLAYLRYLRAEGPILGVRVGGVWGEGPTLWAFSVSLVLRLWALLGLELCGDPRG